MSLPVPSEDLSSTALRLTGRDTLDLLHRISTQSLTDLPAGQARATLFCDFRARLLHRAIVVRLGDESVWLLRDDAPGAPLAEHLDKHIFREDVRVEDWSDRLSVRGRIDGKASGAGTVTETDGRPTHVVLAASALLEVVPASTPPQGTAFRFVWEIARIATGRPRHGHEIAEAFHPFEVGLWDEVHLSKGCYTGQEVLQRLMTYNSVRRGLARVAGPGPAPATPVPACIGDERMGTITSAIAAGEGWAGLAVLSSRALETDAEVCVEDGVQLSGITAFAAGRPRGLDAPVG